MQQYSIVVIVFIYLFLTRWDSHFQFQCSNFLPKMYQDRYLTNECSYRTDFTDFDAVYGSDDGRGKKSLVLEPGTS